MVRDNETLPQRISDSLAEVLKRQLGEDQQAIELFQWFLASRQYSRAFVKHLIAVAQGKNGDSWSVRRLATLMLQVHLLALDVEDTKEFEFLFRQLRLTTGRGEYAKLPKSLLKEGYSTRDLPGFIDEFRRRLMRPRTAIDPRRKKHVTSDHVRAFVEHSRQECKLALGRYMFSPDEVVARIRERVQVLKGLPLIEDDGPALEQAKSVMLDLPKYEAAILEKLQAGGPVYWVADLTSANLNSLVEYPIGTVVLVVKPPGSHYEFELKRAGRKGRHPLSARSHVPPSHRLDGCSMLSALQWEARNAALLGKVYRHVHGQPAPLSTIVQTIGKHEVPIGKGKRSIIEYLTYPEIYGEGYDEMRKAMAIVVECFRKERGKSLDTIPGDIGLTLQFVTYTGPAQAILCGSSSFRLDLLTRYLSQDGPNAYFKGGLQVDHTDLDAKRLADDLLDEILAVYDPPNVAYRDYEQYVEAAMAVPKNRAKANTVYCDLLTQIGTLWGTLLAVRGYSFGESFVARNVGLRTIWSQGEWCVRLVFQDHDNLVLPDRDQSRYRPMTAVPSHKSDDRYIMGRDGDERLDFELNCLRRIYRVDEPLFEKGQKRLRNAIKRAYVKTQEAMTTDPQVQPLFNKQFREKLRDWDTVARKYLARNGSSQGQDWKSRVERFLMKRGYPENSIEEHCGALERHEDLIEKYSYLYRAKIGKP